MISDADVARHAAVSGHEIRRAVGSRNRTATSASGLAERDPNL
jgi:hypothetical protein